MSLKYDVVATIGSYEKNGEKKYISRRVGAVVSTQHGYRLKLDASFNPAGCPRGEDGGVWLALFEPRDNQQSNQQQAPQQNQGGQPQYPQGDGFESDDIPFAPLNWRVF